MQPTHKFRKPLLACALLMGAGNTFIASAETFTVSAGAVPDVAVSIVVGTQVSFGSSIIGNKSGSSCAMQGVSHVDDADMLYNFAEDTTNPNLGNLMTATPIAGAACIDSTTGGEGVILEIDGADSSTVSVSVPDVTGTGWVYTPTAQSCVLDFDRVLNSSDSCVSLATNSVTGVGMSATQANGTAAAANMDVIDGATGYADIVGKTRMILAGSLTLNADLGQGTIVSDNILVQVTYE